MERIQIICGHYGTGKTNYALNLALDAAAAGTAVTLVDLDVVNLYFATSEYRDMLKQKGINVISPNMAGTTLDAPSLSAGIFSVFDREDGLAILDLGGDDVGATALGRFAQQIRENGYDMRYVINFYREQVNTPQKARTLLREIEAACHLQASSIVNNSHLGEQTTAEDIRKAIPYAQETAELLKLPLLANTVPKSLEAQLDGMLENVYPVEVIVKLPWT